MATKQSNLKIMPKEKLDFLHSYYKIEPINSNCVLFSNININRQVLHNMNEKIVINLTKQKLGSVIIFPDAIKYYVKDKLCNTKWSIFEIQNAINVLKMSHQDVNKDNILEQLTILENYYKKEVNE